MTNTDDPSVSDNSASLSQATTSGEVLSPARLTACDARHALVTGELSAVALLESCIGHVEKVNPAVNALIAENFAAARLAAADLDKALGKGARPGRLHGLPVAIKDIQDIAGIPTTWGNIDLSDAVAEQDSPIVARIRREGGVLIGKTNVPEKSIGANTVNPLFGATGNPFAPELTCGGSSGGAAVALATFMAPLATGSDHGGSLRIPACYSGVVGMRPTPGVVPNEQRKFPQTNYAVQGPMGRSVRDVALLLSVIAQRDAASKQDPMAFPLDAAALASPPALNVHELRVGYSADLGGVLVSAAVREQFAQRLVEIQPLVKSLNPCSIDLTDAPRIDWHLRQELFAAAYAEEAPHWDATVNPNVRATYESAIATPMQAIAQAKKRQLELTRQMADCFEHFDVLLVPGVSIPPFPWRQLNPALIDGKPVTNYMAWLELTAALTVVGHPVVALPCGRDRQGTPFGIQVVGPMFEDRALLGASNALERAFSNRDLLSAPTADLEWLAAQDAGCATDGRRVQAQAAMASERGEP